MVTVSASLMMVRVSQSLFRLFQHLSVVLHTHKALNPPLNARFSREMALLPLDVGRPLATGGWSALGVVTALISVHEADTRTSDAKPYHSTSRLSGQAEYLAMPSLRRRMT